MIPTNRTFPGVHVLCLMQSECASKIYQARKKKYAHNPMHVHKYVYAETRYSNIGRTRILLHKNLIQPPTYRRSNLPFRQRSIPISRFLPTEYQPFALNIPTNTITRKKKTWKETRKKRTCKSSKTPGPYRRKASVSAITLGYSVAIPYAIGGVTRTISCSILTKASSLSSPVLTWPDSMQKVVERLRRWCLGKRK